MTTDLLVWDEDDQTPDPEAEYRTLLNGLRRTEGFGLFFVQCPLSVSNKIINQLSRDIASRNIETLSFEASIKGGNLFKAIKTFIESHEKTEILFIQGIEYSLYEYEETKRRLGWSNQEIYTYTWKDVPDVLVNLNQQREKFRDCFANVKLVFFLPSFALKYIIVRAPDFFDWKSGQFKFEMTDDQFNEISQIIIKSQAAEDLGEIEKVRKKILDIQSLIEERKQEDKQMAELLSEQSKLFLRNRDYEAVVVNFEKLLLLKPKDVNIWVQRGKALSGLNRDQEALESLNKAIELDENHEEAWISKGICLRFLERPQESLAAFNKAKEVNPINPFVWHYIGMCSHAMRDYKAAAEAYEKTIELDQDFVAAYLNLSHALADLGQNEEALNNYNLANILFPKEYGILFHKARFLARIGHSREAIQCYSKVIDLKSDFSTAWHNQALAMAGLGHHKEAINGYQKAIELSKNSRHNPSVSYWCMASSLKKIGRIEEAIEACHQSLKFLPDKAWGAEFNLADLYFRAKEYKKAYLQLIIAIKKFRPTDPGWREWFERRIAIELNQHHLSFMIPIWIRLLELIRFRSSF